MASLRRLAAVLLVLLLAGLLLAASPAAAAGLGGVLKMKHSDGHTKGFEVIEIIVDVENCLQAFVGVAPDPRSVIIAFRGTQQHSVTNWIEDLFWKHLDVKYGSQEVQLMTFGQPRIGNPAFTSYFSEQVPRTIRRNPSK